MIAENKLGEKFEVSSDEFNKILATESILEIEFKQFEGSLEDYYKRAKDIIGEPQYPSTGPEGLVLGGALFTGLREYGSGFITELLKKKDAKDYVLYLTIFLAEAMTSAMNKANKEDSETTINSEE